MVANYFKVRVRNIKKRKYYVSLLSHSIFYCATIGLFVSVSLAHTSVAQKIDINDAHVTAIEEIYHIQETIGKRVWPGWTTAKGSVPFLLKTRDHDFLLYHPHPPSDFKRIKSKKIDLLYIRKNLDSTDFQTIQKLAGIQTVVMTEPSPDLEVQRWILAAIHEMFHAWQMPQLESNSELNRLFTTNVGQYDNYNDLNFPFEYSNDLAMAACRIESDRVFNILTNGNLNDSDRRVFKKLFFDIFKIQQAVIDDSLKYAYKQKTEWVEGVARYVEASVRLTLARDKDFRYMERFQKTYPNEIYFGDETQILPQYINPVKFVGEGVRFRVMFYYSGMGKAFMLDKLIPNWKAKYFTNTLDAIIAENQELNRFYKVQR